MKIATKDLTGPALDWATAKAEGALAPLGNLYLKGTQLFIGVGGDLGESGEWVIYQPSTDWSQGGPVIDREGINIRAIRKDDHELHGQWLAAYDHGNTETMVRWVKRADWPRHYFAGPTPLVAAMRCFVASTLDDEVDIPEELL